MFLYPRCWECGEPISIFVLSEIFPAQARKQFNKVVQIFTKNTTKINYTEKTKLKRMFEKIEMRPREASLVKSEIDMN